MWLSTSKDGRVASTNNSGMISVEHLKVEFSAKALFEDVSFVVNKRDRIALVGKNGAGKSTMLKIIAGLQQPTDGRVAVQREVSVGYLPQVMVLSDDTTVVAEVEKAFAHLHELRDHVAQLNRELMERSDYETPEYMELVEAFSRENDRLQMMGAQNYHAEIERSQDSVFCAVTLNVPRKSFREDGACASNWQNSCWRVTMCCSSTSLPTTSTLRVSAG